MGATNSTQTSTLLTTSSHGSLQGLTVLDKNNNKPVYTRYTRIPYALPPTGSRRFRRPVPLPADFTFGSPGNYKEFGDICPQPNYSHSSAVLPNPNAAPDEKLVQSEDCLYLNIWVPAGSVPEGGWPVQFYIHGGWLQMGNAMQDSMFDPFDLLKSYPRVIVSPTYRLNLLGYLASCELLEEDGSSTGNFGFWDQRLALEWTHANISSFGGNPANISVGGLSAGAHSAIFQLHHDTYLPEKERLIKRVFLFSNAIGIQPKPTTSLAIQEQFNELVSALGIDSSLTGPEKLAALRTIPHHDLISVISTLKHHTFRATTDNAFIASTFLSSIYDGSFTTLLADHGIKILLGEVANEETLYRLVNPATSYSDLQTQLDNYYPSAVSKGLLSAYQLPAKEAREGDWATVGGQILGDAQVHAVVRGFANSLLCPPAGATALSVQQDVFRYRISWRAGSLDEWLRPEVKCCHASDIPLWWLSGVRAGFGEADVGTAKGLLDGFQAFVNGERVGWETGKKEDIRHVTSDGRVVVEKDERWEEGLRIWNVMLKAQGFGRTRSGIEVVPLA